MGKMDTFKARKPSTGIGGLICMAIGVPVRAVCDMGCIETRNVSDLFQAKIYLEKMCAEKRAPLTWDSLSSCFYLS